MLRLSQGNIANASPKDKIVTTKQYETFYNGSVCGLILHIFDTFVVSMIVIDRLFFIFINSSLGRLHVLKNVFIAFTDSC